MRIPCLASLARPWLAVIMDPVEVDKILHHLINTGRAPPGLDSYREN
jgi:hypothetical protein